MSQEPASRRPVRSFVRRSGRMTPAQRRALERHLPTYGLPADRALNLAEAFGREAPRCVEIGFGAGDALLAMAGASPERDFLGVEVHEPGVGRLLHRAAECGLSNLRVIVGDAAEVLERCLPERSLHDVCLFFPDPWPKKRHHKRRLVNPAFVGLVASRMVPGGRFLLATDWHPYAEHMLEVLEAEPALRNLAGRGRYSPRAPERPLTRFERRAADLGHTVRDLAFARVRLGEKQRRWATVGAEGRAKVPGATLPGKLGPRETVSRGASTGWCRRSSGRPEPSGVKKHDWRLRMKSA